MSKSDVLAAIHDLKTSLNNHFLSTQMLLHQFITSMDTHLAHLESTIPTIPKSDSLFPPVAQPLLPSASHPPPPALSSHSPHLPSSPPTPSASASIPFLLPYPLLLQQTEHSHPPLPPTPPPPIPPPPKEPPPDLPPSPATPPLISPPPNHPPTPPSFTDSSTPPSSTSALRLASPYPLPLAASPILPRSEFRWPIEPFPIPSVPVTNPPPSETHTKPQLQPPTPPPPPRLHPPPPPLPPSPTEIPDPGDDSSPLTPTPPVQPLAHSLSTTTTSLLLINSPLPTQCFSPAEIKEKRDRGVCYNCDNIWSLSHHCCRKFHLLMECEKEIETMMICGISSLHNLSWSTSLRSMHHTAQSYRIFKIDIWPIYSASKPTLFSLLEPNSVPQLPASPPELQHISRGAHFIFTIAIEVLTDVGHTVRLCGEPPPETSIPWHNCSCALLLFNFVQVFRLGLLSNMWWAFFFSHLHHEDKVNVKEWGMIHPSPNIFKAQ